MTTNDRPRVLICEDNMPMRGVIRFNFEDAGFEVTDFFNGQLGWEAAQDQQFDLVVTDQQMPRMMGVDLCRHIRGLPNYRDVPLILLTAKSFEMNAEALRTELGICRVICKPFSPSRLVRTAQDLLAVSNDA